MFRNQKKSQQTWIISCFIDRKNDLLLTSGLINQKSANSIKRSLTHTRVHSRQPTYLFSCVFFGLVFQFWVCLLFCLIISCPFSLLFPLLLSSLSCPIMARSSISKTHELAAFYQSRPASNRTFCVCELELNPPPAVIQHPFIRSTLSFHPPRWTSP